MSDKKAGPVAFMSCDFMIRGQVPREAFELFAVGAARTMGLRGYITQVSEDTYKGQLQGEERLFEAFKKLILAAAEYVEAIKEFVINNLKVIQEYTCEAFEIKMEKIEKK